jgi:hypothetical protein
MKLLGLSQTSLLLLLLWAIRCDAAQNALAIVVPGIFIRQWPDKSK